MPEYRAYIIGNDGLFIGAEYLRCDNDEVAIQSAKQLINGHDVELWLGDRKIAKFDALIEPRTKPRTNSVSDRFNHVPNASLRGSRSGRTAPFFLLGALTILCVGIGFAFVAGKALRPETTGSAPTSVAIISPITAVSAITTTGIANPPAAVQLRIVGTPVTNNPTPSSQTK